MTQRRSAMTSLVQINIDTEARLSSRRYRTRTLVEQQFKDNKLPIDLVSNLVTEKPLSKGWTLRLSLSLETLMLPLSNRVIARVAHGFICSSQPTGYIVTLNQ